MYNFRETRRNLKDYCILEQIFREVKWEGKDLKILGKNLTNLRFADDIVLVAKIFKELVSMGEDQKYHSEKYGLTMNMEKTKFMFNGEGINEIRINVAKLSRVSEYRYLGQTSKFNNNMDEVIEERILNARKFFWKNKIFLNSKMKTNLKIKILESCMLSVLTYEAQTWSLTNGQVNSD